MLTLSVLLVAVFLPVTSKAYESGSPYYAPSVYVDNYTTSANVHLYEPDVTYTHTDDPEYWRTTFHYMSDWVSAFSTTLYRATDELLIDIPSMVIGTRSTYSNSYVNVIAFSLSGEVSYGVEYRVRYTYLYEGNEVEREVNLGQATPALDFNYLLKEHISTTFLTPTYLYNVQYVLTAPDAIIGGVTVELPLKTDFVSTYYSEIDANSYNQGYREGYTEGLDVGYESGYNFGYSDGGIAGYDEGYREGYDEGYTEGTDNTTFVSWFLDIADAIMAFNILYLPNGATISVGSLIGLICVVPLLVWFLKMFAGG